MKLLLDLEKAKRPLSGQMGLFGSGPKPPGSGWQPIPRGSKGGFRRRVGRRWEYWYGNTGITDTPTEEAHHPTLNEMLALHGYSTADAGFSRKHILDEDGETLFTGSAHEVAAWLRKQPEELVIPPQKDKPLPPDDGFVAPKTVEETVKRIIPKMAAGNPIKRYQQMTPPRYDRAAELARRIKAAGGDVSMVEQAVALIDASGWLNMSPLDITERELATLQRHQPWDHPDGPKAGRKAMLKELGNEEKRLVTRKYGSEDEAFRAMMGDAPPLGQHRTREWLKENGYLSISKSTELHKYGYQIVNWLKVSELKRLQDGEDASPEAMVYEYVPRANGKERYTAATETEIDAVHDAIGAPRLLHQASLGIDLGERTPRERGQGSPVDRNIDLKQKRDDAQRRSQQELWDATRDAAEEENVTPGTKVAWRGIRGWLEGYQQIKGRRPSSPAHAALDAHLKQDLGPTLDKTVTPETIRDLLDVLHRQKRSGGTPKVQAAIAANEVKANNRLQAIKKESKPPRREPMTYGSHSEAAQAAKEGQKVRHYSGGTGTGAPPRWILVNPDGTAVKRPELPMSTFTFKSSQLVIDLEKARFTKKPHPKQVGFFGGAAQRPPGSGWQVIPRGRKGGYRRRKGKGWEYWYPGQGVQAQPHADDPAEQAPKPEPKLVLNEPRKDDVTEAMSDKRTKGQRKNANELALDIVKKAKMLGRGLTDEEAVKVAAYTGKGGISGDLNQFYTRTDIAKSMWDLMAAYQDQIETVLEPSCGSGVFLQTAPKGAKVTGVELDRSAAAVAELLHGNKHTVQSTSFEEFTIENSGKKLDFDAVIANPPYCTRTGDIPLDKPQFKSADKYFIDTSLDHVKDGGLCAMLIHPGVMNNKGQGWREFRKDLLARAEVVDAFRLPDDTFKHVHCEISADIVLLRKRDSKVGAALLEAQKHDDMEPALKSLNAWDQDFIGGNYFDKHPERILGKALTADETGWRATVVGDADKVPEMIRNLTESRIKAGKLPKDITIDELAAVNDGALKGAIKAATAKLELENKAPVLGQVKVMANRRYLYIGDPPRWKLMESVDDVSQIINHSGDAAVKEAHSIALDLQELIKARDAGEFYRSRNIRRIVSDRVKAWVTENGIPGSHRALGELSKSAVPLLDFMACVDSNGELSDLLNKDAAVTLKPAEVDRTNLISVADHIARRNSGYVTPDDLQHNWEGWDGESTEQLQQLVLDSGSYVLSEGQLQHAEDYLTGDLYEKLDDELTRLELAEDEDRPQLQSQVDMIRARLATKYRSIDDIPIQLKVLNWMPLEWFDAYLNSPEGRRDVFKREPLQPGSPVAKMKYEKGVYTLQEVAPAGGIERDARKKNKYGYHELVKEHVEEGTVLGYTSDRYDFLKYMNRVSLNKGAKEKAKDIEQHIEKGFNDWIKESDLRKPLEDLYNRTFNGEFRKEYSGDELGLEGMSEGIIPHDYQNQAVRWAAETGRGILGQDVGLGKTFIAILLAKLRKQKGIAKKPMVVVPKSVATNWAEEVQTLFPGSKVLIIGETRKESKHAKKKAQAAAHELGLTGHAFDRYVEENRFVVHSDSPLQRNHKLAQMKQNDYDLVICTKPAFNAIPLRQETIDKYEEEDFWYQRAGQIDRAMGRSSQEAADKQIERLRGSWATDALQRKFDIEEALIPWEDLGVDCLMADEAHAYKNLYAAKSRFGDNPKFLGGSGQSITARKMQHMSRWVRDSNPNNAVYFLTATPTKNSPLEVFNMLQHIAPEAFQKIGIENSEQFIDRFCNMDTRLILTPPGKKEKKKKDDDGDVKDREEFAGAGNLESAMCVTGFTNLKELETIMDKFMMIQTATDVGLKIPEANHQMHMVDMTEEQKAVYHELREEANDLDRQEDPGGMFRIMDRMKKAAQDLELYDPEEYDGWYSNSPKYQACVDAAAAGARERGGQIIFCDHNASHERLKAMLMAKGFKSAEIGIINAQVAKDSEVRQKIGNGFNNGTIKVVIGNTGTMGEGVNLQGKKHKHGTTDIHHLDQPWDPGTMHQRNGRGVRQGNNAEQVQIHTYLAKGSFDGFRHSTLKGKERWLDKLRSGADSIANDMEGQGLDEVEMLAMLSDDPDAAMEAIASKRASAKSAWYIKESQKSVDNFNKWQSKVTRLPRLKDGATKDKLSMDVDRIKRILLRDELLPDNLKERLESGNTDPVATVTYMTTSGLSATMKAQVVENGTVVRSEGQRFMISGIDPIKRKVTLRHWGDDSEFTVDTDALQGREYTSSKVDPNAELREALKRSSSSSYSGPLENIWHVSDEVLEQNRDVVDASVRAWLSEHGQDDLVLVRDGGRIQSVKGSEVGDKEIVYPWGKGEDAIIAAAVDGNENTAEWRRYQNDIVTTLQRSYGYSTGTWGRSSQRMKTIVNEAEAIWKKTRKQR